MVAGKEGREYYRSIGFKCGLEIHQRLLTKTKLFCPCDASLDSGWPIAKIYRRQKAVVGELGKMDLATEFESSKRRMFIYSAFRNTSCMVDVDEEPPHAVNSEALEIALLIASAFDAEVPDEIEPMRKEVVDGSDPSAFQRTMEIGFNGHIDVGGRKISIPFISLEEESAGIQESTQEFVVYDVSRLGIPLIEIDTLPEIETPEEAKEAAYRIGLLLRLTGKVQRGIGTIRQDVNISIAGGARVELKGFQELDIMDKVIRNEIERQLKLIEIKKQLEERKAKVHEPVDVTALFSSTRSKIISENSKGGKVLGIRLEGFKGLIGTEINPNRRLGTEISEYARLAGVRGIIHSDEDLDSYGLSTEEIGALKKTLAIGEKDGFMLIAGKAGIVEDAARFAEIRARLAISEVPKETRVVDSKTLTTRFLRPLPGKERMYPETDIKPILVDRKYYLSLKHMAPDIEREREKLAKEIGNKQLADQLLGSQSMTLYRKILSETGADPVTIASFILEKMKELRRGGIDVDRLSDELLVYIFKLFKEGKITRNGIYEIAKRLPKDKESVDSIIESEKLRRLSDSELLSIVRPLAKLGKEKIIREVMSKYRLNVDGDSLIAIIDKVVG